MGRQRLHVIHSGIDTERYTPGPADAGLRSQLTNNDPTAPVILVVARLVPAKGIDHVIRAVASLPASLAHTNLAIAGAALDPAYEQNLHQLGAQLLRDRIHFLGPRDDVAELLRASDALVLASESEGLGLCILEAQACGVPAIAYPAGGCAELIQHNVTGLLATQGNPEDLGHQLTRLLGNPALAKELTANALTQVLAHHSISRTGRAATSPSSNCSAGVRAPGTWFPGSPATLRANPRRNPESFPVMANAPEQPSRPVSARVSMSPDMIYTGQLPVEPPVTPPTQPNESAWRNVAVTLTTVLVLAIGGGVIFWPKGNVAGGPVAQPVGSATASAAAAATPATVATHTGSGPSGVPMPTGNITGWKQTFAEDFNSGNLSDRWYMYEGQPGGDPGGWFLPSHVSQSNGRLVITGFKENTPNGNIYATGGVSNARSFSQTYGRFEFRFRMDRGIRHQLRRTAVVGQRPVAA